MSVLEKIVKAEKDARAQVLKAEVQKSEILSAAHDEVATLQAKNAADLATQLKLMVEDANKEISKLNAKFVTRKAVISDEVTKSATTKKDKLIEKIFKDVTGQ